MLAQHKSESPPPVWCSPAVCAAFATSSSQRVRKGSSDSARIASTASATRPPLLRRELSNVACIRLRIDIGKLNCRHGRTPFGGRIDPDQEMPRRHKWAPLQTCPQTKGGARDAAHAARLRSGLSAGYATPRLRPPFQDLSCRASLSRRHENGPSKNTRFCLVASLLRICSYAASTLRPPANDPLSSTRPSRLLSTPGPTGFPAWTSAASPWRRPENGPSSSIPFSLVYRTPE